MADVFKTVSILFKGDDSGASAAAKRVADSIDDLDASTKRSNSSGNLWQDSAGKWRNQLGQFATDAEKAAAGIESVGKSAKGADEILKEIGQYIGIAFIAKSFLDANVEVERFVKGVTSIKGSTSEANLELGYLRATSDRLGLAVRDTSDAYVSLLAATKGTRLEGEPTRQIFEAVSSAMSKLGKSSADTEGALLAIQQVISKGTVSSEELRGQLGERLPGAFQIAARSVGVTTQELGKLLESGSLIADDFLPKFAEELNKTFGAPERVDGYTASVNRLQNAFDLLLVRIGDTGLFDAVATAAAKGADATGVFAIGIQSLADKWEQTKRLFTRGELDIFTGGLSSSEKAALEFVRSLQGPVNETLAETARLLRQNGEAAKNAYPDETANETKRLAAAANTLTDQLKREAEALKILKVNRDEVNRSTKDYANLIETLGKSKSVTDAEFLQAVANAAKNIRAGTNDVIVFKDALSDAGVVGARNGDTIAKAFKLVDDAAKNAAKGTDKQAEALKKQAEEAKKAEEAQERLRLELEKLASNERIKLIEARVQLNVAEVQEQTKRIQAAFESLDNTVNSTADVINKAFGVLGDQTSKPWIDTDLRNKLFEQIDRENTFRERALKTQEELTQAQVDLLRQQARQIERGDALIKVDGSGLAPHLEAFMWEILKAVQVRTNRDGLKLLLGVT